MCREKTTNKQTNQKNRGEKIVIKHTNERGGDVIVVSYMNVGVLFLLFCCCLLAMQLELDLLWRSAKLTTNRLNCNGINSPHICTHTQSHKKNHINGRME